MWRKKPPGAGPAQAGGHRPTVIGAETYWFRWTEDATTANDNVLLSRDPVARELLLSLLSGCQDLRDATARLTEAVLNALMSAQADEACGAGWGERSGDRVNSRNGYRERGLSTTVGELTLEIPKLRKGSYFPGDLLARWDRADATLAAAIAEMYVAGVSTRKVEAVAARLGPDSMSGSRASSMCAALDGEVAEFRTRPLDWQRWCYLWLDATWVRCRVDGRSVSQAVVTAIALGEDGCKHLCGVDVLDTESYEDWRGFLGNLRSRGMRGVSVNLSFADFTNEPHPFAPTHMRRSRQRHAPLPASRSGARSLVR